MLGAGSALFAALCCTLKGGFPVPFDLVSPFKRRRRSEGEWE